MQVIKFLFLGLTLADKPGYVEFNPMFGSQDTPIAGALKTGTLGYFIRRGLPVNIRDFYKLFVVEPPIRLATPRNLKHGSVEDIKDNYVNSIISICDPKLYPSHECTCPETYADVQALDDRSIYSLAVLAVNKRQKKIILSYRGTGTVQNILDDFNFQMTSSPEMPEEAKVHHGFYTHYMTLYYHARTAMLGYLKDPRYAGYGVQLTGYSLGAAIATLSLPSWIDFLNQHNQTRPIELYLYSSPRVGNAHFANYIDGLNVPITRYTFQNDPVPHLPPRSYEFVHVGVEIHEQVFANDTKTYTICSQEYDEDPECAWKQKDHLQVEHHFTPFNHTFPAPPVC
ncbi:hypothetical protein DSO57_1004573 [Entomophthora muscae]|uniref:Uncharacterized protein n=1 Tax=Entomophthora muscae TaxID=34485 RepID=A0ACC2RZ89_9FUNG|nr:hypothetical protein DSO57_1004573 [Entomophthora muscae]